MQGVDGVAGGGCGVAGFWCCLGQGGEPFGGVFHFESGALERGGGGGCDGAVGVGGPDVAGGGCDAFADGCEQEPGGDVCVLPECGE